MDGLLLELLFFGFMVCIADFYYFLVSKLLMFSKRYLSSNPNSDSG